MKKFIILLSLCVLVTACIKPYQPDIQQGNIINDSDLSQIIIGMNKQEVLFILGSPMVSDPFNTHRWDYFYSKLDRRKNTTEKRLITVTFDGDKLITINGDLKGFNGSKEDLQRGGTIMTKPTHKPKGLFDRLFK